MGEYVDSSSRTSCHLVAVPLQTWGHARPLCALLARLLRSRPLVVTLFASHKVYPQIATELSRSFTPEQSTLRARVRLIALPSTDKEWNDEIFSAAFADAYSRLHNEEPISCTYTGSTFKTIRSPNAVILDVAHHSIFMEPAFASIRKADRDRLKVYCYSAAGGFTTHRIPNIVSSELAEEGLLRDVLTRKALANGKTMEDLMAEIFFDVNGTVKTVLGLPPMYDHEMYIQEVVKIFASRDPYFYLKVIETMEQCDSIIISTSKAFEPPASTEKFADWMERTSRKLYYVGPAMPSGKHAFDTEKTLSEDAKRIESFMEKVLQTNGPHSMLFISFGSIWWPTDSSKIWAFVDVLLEKKIPFIMGRASPLSSLPEGQVEKINSSGIGLLTSWVPQQSILTHPATGWFVTHCGFNSIMESIAAGVPMICWPLAADQMHNSIHVTDNHDIAYELVEVRTGEHATKPIYRTGKVPVASLDAVRKEAKEILEKAFGEDGERKRANITRLRDAIAAESAENGPSSRALEDFLDALYANTARA